jgi:hypothetical protein
MPSSNIDSCAGVSVTEPSLVTGHTKRPFSQPLGKQAEALAVPVEDLHKIAAPAAEGEQVAGERVLLQHLLRHHAEAVEALPEMQIATTEDLDVVCDVISDAMLAHVLATSPWRQRTKAALPVRVQEPLRKARRNLN